MKKLFAVLAASLLIVVFLAASASPAAADGTWRPLFSYDFDNGGYSPTPPFHWSAGAPVLPIRKDQLQCPTGISPIIKCLYFDVPGGGSASFVAEDSIASTEFAQHGFRASWNFNGNTSAPGSSGTVIMRGVDRVDWQPGTERYYFRVQLGNVNNEQKVRIQCKNNSGNWVNQTNNNGWIPLLDRAAGQDSARLIVTYIQSYGGEQGFCSLDEVNPDNGQLVYSSNFSLDNSTKTLKRIDFGLLDVTGYSAYHWAENYVSDYIGPYCPPQIECEP